MKENRTIPKQVPLLLQYDLQPVIIYKKQSAVRDGKEFGQAAEREVADTAEGVSLIILAKQSMDRIFKKVHLMLFTNSFNFVNLRIEPSKIMDENENPASFHLNQFLHRFRIDIKTIFQVIENVRNPFLLEGKNQSLRSDGGEQHKLTFFERKRRKYIQQSKPY